MFRARKLNQRLRSTASLDLVPDVSGKLFNTPKGLVDLSDVEIVHTGIDTVKALYTGTMNPFVLGCIEHLYEKGFNQIIDLKEVFNDNKQFREYLYEELGGELKFVVKPGGRSGYRFMLQNNNVGLIIHIGSKFRKVDQNSANFKIEFSPHFIMQHSVSGVDLCSDWLADAFLLTPKRSGVSFHLCADIQGWQPPKDFSQRIVTRSRKIINFLGTQEAIFDDHGDLASVYGKNLGYLYGSVKNVQMSIYRKDIEAKKDNDFDHWEDIWLKTTNYDSEAPVFRIEFRFHQSLLNQVEQGYLVEGLPQKTLKSLTDAMQYADSFWLYGLNTFRLDNGRTYVAPEWQFFAQDITFNSPEILEIKRYRPQPKMGNIKDAVYGISRLVSYYSSFPHMQGNTLMNMLERFDPVLLKNYCDYQEEKGRIAGNYLQESLQIRRMTK